MKEQKWVIGIVVALIATAGIFFSLQNKNTATDVLKANEITVFGQFLKDEGAKFYGASWCPHCQSQKELLGKGGWEQIYVECAIEGSNKQAKECEVAKVESYPTWIFKDGTRKTGQLSIKELEEITGYTKKVEVSSTTPSTSSTSDSNITE